MRHMPRLDLMDLRIGQKATVNWRNRRSESGIEIIMPAVIVLRGTGRVEHAARPR